MTRWAWKVVCLIILIGFFAAPGAFAGEDDRPLLEYYYMNVCDACNPADEFRETFHVLTGEYTDDYRYVHYNTYKADGKAKLLDAIERYGLDADAVRLPLVIVDGVAYMGETQIQSDLPRYTISRAESTRSLIYYLYVTACESCEKARRIIEELPETADVKIGSYAFQSELRVEKVDIGANTGLAFALFDAFNVPEEKRLAPIVFIGDRYYQGVESIGRFLNFAIARGAGLRTPIIAEEAPLPAIGWGFTAFAGLIGGLNPCALSMLLLFLSLLINMNKNIGTMAALFLASKFAVYLLIGTVFLTLFQAWNPAWLPLAVKVVLTLISAVLIAINLRDAWMAHREQYGDIRNQLPVRLRRGLQSRIRGVLDGSKGSALLIAGLGIVVAAGEFLCAGQVYLATLLTAFQKNRDSLKLFGQLILYCMMFIMPSAIISLLITKGRNALEVSELMRRNMATVKIITAVFFLIVLAVVWFI